MLDSVIKKFIPISKGIGAIGSIGSRSSIASNSNLTKSSLMRYSLSGIENKS